MSITFGSVCSGIEAASVALHPLGWKSVWLSEIAPYPAAVLAYHYPSVPNLGDMTKIARAILVGEVEAPDALIGGTPCQAFSVAGLREGLADERGQLTLAYVRIFDAIDYVRRRAGKRPAIGWWENVPGVLSSKDNAFGCFLAGLAGEDRELQPPGKRWPNAGVVVGPTRTVAWRILDAQYFGVAQRRRRVFVIASARKDFDPVKVLFEFDGVRRDSAPSREAQQDVAGTLASRAGAGGFPGTNEACSGYVQPVASTGDVSHCLNAGGMGRQDFETETLIAQPSEDGTGRGQPIVAFQSSQSGVRLGETHATLDANNGPRRHNGVLQGMAVRRLTPRECERLQGFPDDYTRITVRGKPAADGPRYKALGNSMAVPVMHWIGSRIEMVERLTTTHED